MKTRRRRIRQHYEKRHRLVLTKQQVTSVLVGDLTYIYSRMYKCASCGEVFAKAMQLRDHQRLYCREKEEGK